MKKYLLPSILFASLIMSSSTTLAATHCPEPAQIKVELLNLINNHQIAFQQVAPHSFHAFTTADISGLGLDWTFTANVENATITNMASATQFLKSRVEAITQASLYKIPYANLCDYDSTLHPETRSTWIQLQYQLSSTS